MADEALACFTSLLKNVPAWIADLEGMLKTASQRQEEMLYADRPAEATPVSLRRETQSKSSSLRSPPSEGQSKDGYRPQQWSMARLGNSDTPLRFSQRKRKNASLCSGDHSGPVKSRSKPVMAVYYDGETQHHFERIVRTVGSSRNTIRKAKISAKVESLNRTGSSSSEMSVNSDDEDDMANFSPSTFRLTAKSPGAKRLPYRRDDTECFDQVDCLLEKAQTSIERAAYQVLREGDCTSEVVAAKEHFTQALRLTETETPVFQQKVDKASERRIRSEERRRADEEAEERRKSASQLSQKIVNVVASVIPDANRLDVDELEVDDESDDDAGEFNVSAMRGNFGTFARMRNARLAAH